MSGSPLPVDDAILRLRRVLEERSTLAGPADSALLVALANVVLAYVRRELAREVAQATRD